MDPIIVSLDNELIVPITKKRLVVLGGGFGRLNLIRRLQARDDLREKIEMILIDKKEYYENVLAAARFIVIPDFHSQMVGKYTDYLDYAKFIQGSVVEVNHTPCEVTVLDPNGNLSIVPFDYLVVCLGTSYPIFKPEEGILGDRTSQIKKLGDQIQKAENILVVGGRGVGVEVAAEIASHFQRKKSVTLVHSRGSLMDMWPAPAVDLVHKFMDDNNVKIVNNRVVSSVGNEHTLSDGTIVIAELRIDALGGKANSEAFKKYFSSSLALDGFMKINENQQLLGHENIFVIGDICDIPQNRNALMVKSQVPLVEDNLLFLLSKSTPLMKLDLQGISYAHPYHLALGVEYGIRINPYSNEAEGSKEEADHMTSQYHKIVKMTLESWRKDRRKKQHK